jgi:iron complex transport system substrate-binding protein
MKWWIKILFPLALFAGAAALSGCGGQKNAASAGGYEVTDGLGHTVMIPHKPKRIVGTDGFVDMMLLGVVEPDRLAACSDTDHDPSISYISEETKNISASIPLNGISPELMAQLKPDLIVATSYIRPQEIQAYQNMGVPVVVIRGAKSVDDVKQDINVIAKACGEEERGQKVVQIMDDKLSHIKDTMDKETGPKPRVLLVSQMARYGGPGSMFDDLLNHARIDNVMADVGVFNGQTLSPELIVKSDPDFFIVSKDRSSDTTGAGTYRNEFLSNPAIQDMRASKHILEIDDRYIYSASQNCVYAIEALANAAYEKPLFDLSDEKEIKGF